MKIQTFEQGNNGYRDHIVLQPCEFFWNYDCILIENIFMPCFNQCFNTVLEYMLNFQLCMQYAAQIMLNSQIHTNRLTLTDSYLTLHSNDFWRILYSPVWSYTVLWEVNMCFIAKESKLELTVASRFLVGEPELNIWLWMCNVCVWCVMCVWCVVSPSPLPNPWISLWISICCQSD